MNKYIFDNGLKLIYEHREVRVTSFSIGFDAGANKENEDEIGLAHITEHLLFKGTKGKTEKRINELCDNYFGFNNAMTNYPYVIYYGTTLPECFEKAVEIYSDIIINPSLSKIGFEEEIKVIQEELNVWKDDSELFCEDELLRNSFKTRRLRTRIIGDTENILSYSNRDVVRFYEKYYHSDDCFISVVTSLEFDKVKEIIEKYFKNFNGNTPHEELKLYEENIPGIYTNYKDSLNVARIEYCYTLHSLKKDEYMGAELLNVILGQGVSSLLYDELRTRNSLVYDVHSELKLDKGIMLFIIKAATSNQNISNVLKRIDDTLMELKRTIPNEKAIKEATRRLTLRREIQFEKSIERAKLVSTSNIMSLPYFQGREDLKVIDSNGISRVLDKVLINKSIQILKSRG